MLTFEFRGRAICLINQTGNLFENNHAVLFDDLSGSEADIHQI